MPVSMNAHVAARLEEVAGILEWQGANPYRIRAYRRAALTLRGLGRAARRGPRASREGPGGDPQDDRSAAPEPEG